MNIRKPTVEGSYDKFFIAVIGSGCSRCCLKKKMFDVGGAPSSFLSVSCENASVRFSERRGEF